MGKEIAFLRYATLPHDKLENNTRSHEEMISRVWIYVNNRARRLWTLKPV
jgi:hypothetical protein